MARTARKSEGEPGNPTISNIATDWQANGTGARRDPEWAEANLPGSSANNNACAASMKNFEADVIDCNTNCTSGSTNYTGGGSTVLHVKCNGSNWVGKY